MREQVLGGAAAAALDLLLHLRLAPPPHDQQLSQLPRLLRRRNQVCQLPGLPAWANLILAETVGQP